MTQEIWKDIEDWEGLYQISSFGRVRSLDRWIDNGRAKPYLLPGKVLAQKTSRTGYKQINLRFKDKNKWFSVHRLVALAFVVNEENLPQVNHIDGDKSNNHFSNLEWSTARDNIIHAFELGLKPEGSESWFTELSEEIIHQVCKLLSEGVPNTEVVKVTGVTRGVVSKIKTGKSWKSVSKQYNIPRKTRGLPEEVVVEICELMQEGHTAPEVLELVNHQELTLAKIYSIRKRQYYTSISKNYTWEYNSSKRGKIRG